ncbi:hypothetical protein E8L99_21785 [Phreatobacter aquaticus]|uniref:Uncharacterized protein n=1 Tax=Phreatobacter aquaticus TaxID=2570229 RepID=A0A4D7QKH7_9HYPH|nr:hypothetical protein [Phreatobacter aquaticus]QCK88200.1 hypothetical protein E8L99_21785 [Phreatobacter aquaticus]
MQNLLQDIESRQLEHRIRFLKTRALAHEERAEHEKLIYGDYRHSACAATLLRDAGCLCLLIGNIKEGRQLIFESGVKFLNIGLPYGMLLLTISNIKAPAKSIEKYIYLSRIIMHQHKFDRHTETADERLPLGEASINSPRQILSLIQTNWLTKGRTTKDSEIDEEALYSTLQHRQGYQIGTTGLSYWTYKNIALSLTNNVSKYSFPQTELPTAAKNGFQTLIAIRSENIRRARQNSYQWNLVARPSEILDVDAIVIALLAIFGEMSKELLGSFGQNDDPLVTAPIAIALSLSTNR